MPEPVIAPNGGIVAYSSNFTITAAGLPSQSDNPPGYIFFTTDNSLPRRTSQTYNAGTVGIQLTTNTTVRAISSTLGVTCSDSPIQEAKFTVMPAPPLDAGGLPAIPSITPTGAATTQNNDFTAQITETSSGAIICYTFGTTAPTCTVSASGATCDMGSATYTAPININASTPQTAAGQVELQAIACDAGGKSVMPAMAQFTLQAAAPTMAPMAGTVAYSATVTGSFQDQTSGASVFYTADGTAPSCTAGGSVQAYQRPSPSSPGLTRPSPASRVTSNRLWRDRSPSAFSCRHPRSHRLRVRSARRRRLPSARSA